MPRYNLNPIVRPSDLKGSVTSQVAGSSVAAPPCLVGFESQGDALSLLAAREKTRAQQGSDTRTVTLRTVEATARRWTSLADMPVRMVVADEVENYPWRA